MKALRISIVLCLLGLASSASAQTPAAHPAAAHGTPTLLRMVYSAGQHTAYVTRSVQNAPPPVGTTTTTGQMVIETVAINPDGSAQQRMRITGMDIQSAAIPEAARQQISQGITGLTMGYTQNGRGQITAREAPANVSPQLRPLLDSVLQSLDQMSPQLPENPIGTGQTWDDHRVTHVAIGQGMQMDLTVNVTYTLREIRGTGATQTAIIGLAMTLAIGPSAAVRGQSISGAGTATGEMTLDLAHGILASSRSTGSMNMHVRAQGQTANVPTTFENEMHAAPAGAH